MSTEKNWGFLSWFMPQSALNNVYVGGADPLFGGPTDDHSISRLVGAFLVEKKRVQKSELRKFRKKKQTIMAKS